RDTRTPLRYALVRVILTTGLGCLFALPAGAPLGPRLMGIDPRWGVAGLTASAGFAAWIEFLLLRRGMNRRIGQVRFPAIYFAKLWFAGVVAAAVGWGLGVGVHPHEPLLVGAVVLLAFGVADLGVRAVWGLRRGGG